VKKSSRLLLGYFNILTPLNSLYLLQFSALQSVSVVRILYTSHHPSTPFYTFPH
jgi:hypothetical protein